MLGTLTGLAVVRVLGAVALLLPGQTDLRRGAQSLRSSSASTRSVPPASILNALARIDPFPSIATRGAGCASGSASRARGGRSARGAERRARSRHRVRRRCRGNGLGREPRIWS